VAAAAFDLSIKEFLILKELIPDDPFEQSDTGAAVEFMSNVKKVEVSEFSPEELLYLVKHEYESTDNIAPSEDGIADILEEIQQGLQTIQSENSYSSDPTGEVTKTKLGLFLDEETLQEALDILLETSTLSATDQEAFIEVLKT